MIYGTFSHIELIPALAEPLRFLSLHAASSEDGKYGLEGGMFVEIRHYRPMPPEERRWECHNRYVDLHCVLEGEETLYVHQRPDSTDDIQEDRLATDDVAFVREDSIVSPTPLFMSPGFFAVLFPDDVHKTECLTTVDHGRKAVIKIPFRFFSGK